MFRCLRQRPGRLRTLDTLRQVMCQPEADALLANLQAALRPGCRSQGFVSGAGPSSSLPCARQCEPKVPRTAAGSNKAYSTAAKNTSTSGPVNYASLGITLATGCGLLGYYSYSKQQKLESLRGKDQAVVGSAMVGGPFELVDQRGKRFTDADLHGEFALLYFGFTYCPDICPDELEKVAEAVDAAEKGCGVRIQPVFITVDPQRDNVQQVREYVKEFHPRLIGLTGTPEQVKAAAKSYRVYYNKTNDSPDDYLVDHSIISYLVDPTGKFVTFYGKNFTAEEMAASLQGHVKAWRDSHPEYNSKGK